MRVLFLDDSYVRHNRYLGYGGFCIDGNAIRDLDQDIIEIKNHYRVPQQIELKWSPPKDHFLRRRFKGVRHELYKDIVNALAKHQARVLCAVHGLNDCFGVRIHGWSDERVSLWAVKQQLQFLAERFENNDLAAHAEQGIIISDRYGDRGDEGDLIQDFSFTMIVGTSYSPLRRIALPPLMADSKHTNLIQAADVITGIIVATLGGSKHGIALFEDVARLFITHPHHDAISFCSMFSPAVLGYGLKLFPSGFQPDGLCHLQELDHKYTVTNEGLKVREPTSAS